MLDWLRQKTSALKAAPGPPTWSEDIPEGSDDPLTVGPYKIHETIGRGGMGAVYRGEHAEQPGALCAIKRLTRLDDSSIDRFKREILIGLSLRHPQVCSVTDWGVTANGNYYLVMELLEGEPFSTTLDQAPMPLPLASDYLHQILDGLEAIHKARIIHRDLKPANLFLTRTGTLKIVDFGLATGAVNGPTITRTGQVVGTVQFMAPEQFTASSRVDGRADLFNVGCIGFKMLTGHLPIEGGMDAFLECVFGGGSFTPLTHYRRDLPHALPQWFARLLEFDPKDRFPNVGECRTALNAALTEAV